MKCATCGSDNPAEARFCQDCGNSLSGYPAGGPTRQGMVSFPNAVKLGFQRYFEFKGRSTRAEYWWWSLWLPITWMVSVLTDALLLGDTGAFNSLTFLVLITPSLAVFVRRLHDRNRSGWWLLLGVVPFGAIVVFVFTLQGSNIGTNKYGPHPQTPINSPDI